MRPRPEQRHRALARYQKAGTPTLRAYETWAHRLGFTALAVLAVACLWVGWTILAGFCLGLFLGLTYSVLVRIDNELYRRGE